MRPPRTAGGVLIAAAAVAAAGCLTGRSDPHSSGWLDQVRHAEPDGLFLRTVLLDQPAGSPYLSHGLWDAARNPLPHEKSALLARNGVRVGVVGGILPGEFDQLVTSGQSTLDPMHRTVRPGRAKVVPVNGPLDRCSFAALADLSADANRFEATAAECGLSVTAKPTPGGRVVLTCEPQVQHGDRQGWLKPTADGTGFARNDHKPLEGFPALTFEVTVGPSDFLVVGPTADPADTLGQAFFIAASPDRVRQRVLVVRAGRGETPAPDARESPSTAAAAGQLRLPLARGATP